MIREVKILTSKETGFGPDFDGAALAQKAEAEVGRLQGMGLTVELQYQFHRCRHTVMVVASGATTEETRARKATLHAIHESNAQRATA